MLKTVLRVFFITLGLYIIFIIALHTRRFQREILFTNSIDYPRSSTLKNPTYHGFPDKQVNNFYIENKLGNKLGAWQVIPTESYWREINNERKSFDDKFYSSFLTNSSITTVIYLHGKFGNRAVPVRVFNYQKLATINNFNVITVDYTGFGDSKGIPTEKNIVDDSKAVWDWLIKKGTSPERIIIMGHSLGSGIATKLVEKLQNENVKPKAMVLKGPFTSLKKALFDHKLFGTFSFMGPIGHIPQLKEYLGNVLKFEFDSLSIINKLRLPILILHGEDDGVFPISHGEDLFRAVSNSTTCKKASQMPQGALQSVEVLSSECQSHFVQFARFNHISHSNFHRFDSVFKVIQKFFDKTNN